MAMAGTLVPATTGKTFFAVLSTSANLSTLQDLFTFDAD